MPWPLLPIYLKLHGRRNPPARSSYFVSLLLISSSTIVADVSTKAEANFLLRDEKAEVKYGMKLEEALERARQLRGTLFIDKIFYVTPKTKVDFKLLKSVVTTHGGQVSS